jgi:H+-transporting ATPase
LLGAIVATQVFATLMCAFGWLVPQISWQTIGAVWAYNITWMFILGAVRLSTEKVVDFRTRHHQRSAAIVTQSLQPHVPGSAGSAA